MSLFCPPLEEVKHIPFSDDSLMDENTLWMPLGMRFYHLRKRPGFVGKLICSFIPFMANMSFDMLEPHFSTRKGLLLD